MNTSSRVRPLRLQENLEVVWPGSPTDFPHVWLGYDDDHLLYTFFQVSPSHPEGWVGIEAFVRPPAGVPVAAGYGALPIRVWGRDFIAEASGDVAAGSAFLAPRYYLSEPAYEPYGGIHPSLMVHDAYVERTHDGDIRFVSRRQPGGVTLSQLASGGGGAPPGLDLTALLGIGLLGVALYAVSKSGGFSKKLVVNR